MSIRPAFGAGPADRVVVADEPNPGVDWPPAVSAPPRLMIDDDVSVVVAAPRVARDLLNPDEDAHHDR